MTASIHGLMTWGRPRIEAARDCTGWYVLRGDHGWLHGDRSAALSEFRELERFEKHG